MIKAKELQSWANEILPVLTDINISMTNLRIIKVESDRGLHIINHGFFRYMWSQQRFILYVQLSKLFAESNNQKRNYNKLFNRIESEPFDSKIEELISENNRKLTSVFKSRKEIIAEISSIRQRLFLQKNNIDAIIWIRDKVCAHTDPSERIPHVKHEDFEVLVSLANDIYNTIFGKIFDRYFDLSRTSDWDLRYIIKKLPQKISAPEH